jgi:hypothetical protein
MQMTWSEGRDGREKSGLVEEKEKRRWREACREKNRIGHCLGATPLPVLTAEGPRQEPMLLSKGTGKKHANERKRATCS